MPMPPAKADWSSKWLTKTRPRRPTCLPLKHRLRLRLKLPRRLPPKPLRLLKLRLLPPTHRRSRPKAEARRVAVVVAVAPVAVATIVAAATVVGAMTSAAEAVAATMAAKS